MATWAVLWRVLVIAAIVAAVVVPTAMINESSNRAWLWIPLYWIALCVAAVAITAYIHCA